MPRLRRKIGLPNARVWIILLIIVSMVIVLVGSANQIIVATVEFKTDRVGFCFDEESSTGDIRVIRLSIPVYNPNLIDAFISDLNFTLYNMRSGEIVGYGTIEGPIEIPRHNETILILTLGLKNAPATVEALKETLYSGVLSLAVSGKYMLSVLGQPVLPLPFTTALPIQIGDILSEVITTSAISSFNVASKEDFSDFVIPIPIYLGEENGLAKFRFQMPYNVPGDFDFGRIVIKDATLFVNSTAGPVGSAHISYLELRPNMTSVLDVEVGVYVGPEANGTITLLKDILVRQKLDVFLRFRGDIELFGIEIPNIVFPSAHNSFELKYNLPDSATLSGILSHYLSEDYIRKQLGLENKSRQFDEFPLPTFKYLDHDDEWIYTLLEFTVGVPEDLIISTGNLSIYINNFTGYLLFDRRKHSILYGAPKLAQELIVGRVRMESVELVLGKLIPIRLYIDLHKVDATRYFLIQFVKYQMLKGDIEAFVDITVFGMPLKGIYVKVPLDISNRTIGGLIQQFLPTLDVSGGSRASRQDEEEPRVALRGVEVWDYNELYYDIAILLSVRNIQQFPLKIRLFVFRYYYRGEEIGEGRIIEEISFTNDPTKWTNFTFFLRIYNKSEEVEELLKAIIFNYTIVGSISITIDLEICDFRLGILDGILAGLFFIGFEKISDDLIGSFDLSDLFQDIGFSVKQLIYSASQPEFGPYELPNPANDTILHEVWHDDLWTGNDTSRWRAVLQIELNMTTELNFLKLYEVYINILPDPNDPLFTDCINVDKTSIEAKLIGTADLTNESRTELVIRCVIYRNLEYPLANPNQVNYDPTYLILKKIVTELTVPSLLISAYLFINIFNLNLTLDLPTYEIAEIFLPPLFEEFFGSEEDGGGNSGGEGGGEGSFVGSSFMDMLGSMIEYQVGDIPLVEDTSLPHNLARDGSSERANPFIAFPAYEGTSWEIIDVFATLRQDYVHLWLYSLSMPIYNQRAKRTSDNPIDPYLELGFNNKTYVGALLLPGTTYIPNLYNANPPPLLENRFYLDYPGCSAYPFNPPPYNMLPGEPIQLGLRLALRKTSAPYAYVPIPPDNPNEVLIDYITDDHAISDPSPAYDMISLIMWGYEYWQNHQAPTLDQDDTDNFLGIWAYADPTIPAFVTLGLFWSDWKFTLQLGPYIQDGIWLAVNASEMILDAIPGPSGGGGGGGGDGGWNFEYEIRDWWVEDWGLFPPFIDVGLNVFFKYEIGGVYPAWLGRFSADVYLGGAGDEPDYGSTRLIAHIVYPTEDASPVYPDPLKPEWMLYPGFLGHPSKYFNDTVTIIVHLDLGNVGEIIWDIISAGGFWVVVKNVKIVVNIFGYTYHVPFEITMAQWIQVF